MTAARSLNCPTCGAPLETDGTLPVIRCKFCQNMIMLDAVRPGISPETAPEKARGVPEEILALLRGGDQAEAIRCYREIYDVSNTRARYAIQQILEGNLHDPEAGFPSPEIIPVADTTLDPAVKATLVKSAKMMGFMIPAIICLIISGVIALIMFIPGGIFNSQLNAYGPAVLLANESGTTDVITQFYNVNKEARLVGRVNGDNGKLLWEGELLPENQHVDHMLTDGSMVFYVVKDRLTALNVSDGSQAWQVLLPDQLQTSQNSLILLNGGLFTITRNRSLQAYDAISGSLLWNRHLESNGEQIRVIQNHLVIFDEIQPGNSSSLVILDPANGNQLQVITPFCHMEGHLDDDMDFEEGILLDDAGNSLFLIFGLFKGCIQEYDLANGQLIWQYTQETDFNSLNREFYPLLAGEQFFFGDDNDLYAVDMSANQVHLVMHAPDHELLPLALLDDTLLVRSRRSLGTERFELWGVDPSSGVMKWQMVLENGRPLDPPDEYSSLVDVDDHVFTVHTAADGFLLLEFRGEPNQLLLHRINPIDGSIMTEKVVPFKAVIGDFYSSPELIGWQEDVIYLSLENKLYAIDTNDGSILMRK